MREVLERLEALQQIDMGIREIVLSREKIPEQIEELMGETRRQEAEIAALDEKIAEAEREKRMLEERVADYHDKLLKVQQVQASVKNQKEYEAYLKEIDGFRKHKNHFEDEVLRSMEILEDLGGTKGALMEAADLSRQAVSAEVATLAAEMAELDARIAEGEEERKGVGIGIPANLLRQYEGIRKRRLGLAVVSVGDGICGGCNMNLPPQFFNQIMRLSTIEQCPNCRRILLYRPPESQASAS